MDSRHGLRRVSGPAALRAPWRVLAAVVVVLMSLLSVTAAAGSPTGIEARQAAETDAKKATKAMSAGSFRAAAEGFEAAFQKSPNPKWLFSAAGAWKRAGEPARAANAYARYLDVAPKKAGQRAAAKKELSVLARKLGRLEIQAEGASLIVVDGVEIEPRSPTTVYVASGTHLVEARFPDGNVTASPTAKVGALEVVTLAPETPEPPPEPPPPEPTAAPPPKRERSRPLPPLAVWVGAGVTAVAGGLTILSGLDVESQKDTFDKDPSQENLDAGKSKQVRTNVLLAVTGVAAVATGVAAIFFVDWSGGGKGGGVKVGAGPGGVVVRGTF